MSLCFLIPQVFTGHAQTGAWSTRAPMPTARKEISNATVALDQKIYVVGGITSSGTISNALEIYDPVSDTWATGAPLPVAVWRTYASSLNGKLYVFGGYTSTASFPFGPIDRVFEYDPNSDSWSEKAPMPIAAGTSVAITVGDKIHVFGGAANTALDRHQVFDPASNAWENSVNIPTPRSGLTATLIEDEIFVFGGYILAGGVVRQNAVEVFNTEEKQWATAENLPVARVGIAAAAIQGKAYVFGGLPDATISRTLEYDPAENSWTEMRDMPTPVSFMGAASVNDTIYVIGGGPVNLNRFDAVNTNRMFVPPGMPTSVSRVNQPPQRFSLAQNYPNPFNPNTTITFTVEKSSHVVLSIFNLAGQKIRTLVDDSQSVGHKTAVWDGRDDKGVAVSSGEYFYRLETNEFSITRKMLLLK